MAFLLTFLWLVLRDILILFALFFIGGYLADRWGWSRVEKAWWLALLTVALLTFALWFQFGKILILI
ncbi:hypothetical protein BEP19_12755 [Ammoniphilus oxalaticus]|uniref:Uncharacterized protein n=2 Tax=Ammoniphilus oxalaticus TaxID=66863 RepID=A0A419SH27_9BACL|nr:hypothetical protein BEP19_12755 [Ammoniphilus oxalaticus]